MIVPYPDVIHALFVPGSDAREARGLRDREPGWAVPRAWRSAFRDAVGALVRAGELSLEEALKLEPAAAAELTVREVGADPAGVLREVVASGLTAGECEFAWLARALRVPLVTADPRIRGAFPALVLAPAHVPAAAPPAGSRPPGADASARA